MKNLILLSIIVCSLSLFAQDNPDNKVGIQIPKNVWKINIKNSLSSDDNFILISKTLRENNFTIESKDKGSIKSGIHLVDRTASIYYLNFSIKDGAIVIFGQYSDLNSEGRYSVKPESKFYKILNQGMKGSPMKNAFVAMNDFALLLSPDLEYIAD